MSRTRLCAIAAGVALSIVSSGAMGHPAKKVVDLIWEHLGGKDNFRRARYVRFTWAYEQDGTVAVSRDHTWDRYSGDYVLAMKDKETGHDITVYFNVESRKGVALRNGAALEGQEAEKMLDRAYRVFVNDTYWLLASTKLEDYGARLRFDTHEETEEFGTLLVLHVSFENVGLTPGDQYWVYSNVKGRVAKWRYKLEDGTEGEFLWQDEKDCGMGLRFCTRKVTPDGKKAIVFPAIEFTASMDPATFEAPGTP